MSWTTIRTGAAANLTAAGLATVYNILPEKFTDQVSLAVMPGEPFVIPAAQADFLEVHWEVYVRVSRELALQAQQDVDAYVWPGTGGVPTAIMADRTLGGAVEETRFDGVSRYRENLDPQGRCFEAEVHFTSWENP